MRIEIDKAVADGVKIFLFGGRSGFDDLCYDLVTEKWEAVTLYSGFFISCIDNS